MPPEGIAPSARLASAADCNGLAPDAHDDVSRRKARARRRAALLHGGDHRALDAAIEAQLLRTPAA